MNANPLMKAGGACEHLHVGPMPEIPGATVRYIRGAKCADRAGFFDEVSAALQFPGYFGENWDAFNDCLSDVPELAKGPLVLVVRDAEAFLISPKDALTKFRAVVVETASRLAKGKPAKAFHVVYQSELEAGLSAKFAGVAKM